MPTEVLHLHLDRLSLVAAGTSTFTTSKSTSMQMPARILSPYWAPVSPLGQPAVLRVTSPRAATRTRKRRVTMRPGAHQPAPLTRTPVIPADNPYYAGTPRPTMILRHGYPQSTTASRTRTATAVDGPMSTTPIPPSVPGPQLLPSTRGDNSVPFLIALPIATFYHQDVMQAMLTLVQETSSAPLLNTLPSSPPPIRQSRKQRFSPMTRRRAQCHSSSPSLSPPPPVRGSCKQRRSSSSSSFTSPSSSHFPDCHHCHRCCNWCQSHHHSPSSDSDDWALSSPSAAPPPPSHLLACRIKRGKNVNFDSLLLPPLPVGPVPSKARANRPQNKRSVTDLTYWLKAWNRYLCVRHSTQPSLALELSTYQMKLATLFSHYPATACIRYDQLFRQSLAVTPPCGGTW